MNNLEPPKTVQMLGARKPPTEAYFRTPQGAGCGGQRRRWAVFGGSLGLFFLAFFSAMPSAWAATVSDSPPINNVLLVVAALFILGLLPFIFLMTTSFVKTAVVFSLIRSALGTQQIPPNQVITGLAIILTIYIMMPVGFNVYHEVQAVLDENKQVDKPILDQANVPLVKEAFDRGKEPLRAFLVKHASAKNRNLFVQMSHRLYKGNDALNVTDQDFGVIVPAFVITELAEAFQIGFLIFLPFLVIDMVVSNILLSLGMFQLSPITVALPFKLLLFVLVDGWYLIVQGLIKGYL